jgi:hypothetical protein
MKNDLTRNISSNTETFVYQRSQYEGAGYPTQELARTSQSSDVNLVNRPFDNSTGQWRSFNLKVNHQGGYGGENGVILKFGFTKDSLESNSPPLSAACGFTIGIPPLHGRHINSVTRLMAYGFIVNPFGFNVSDVLYVQHGRNLIDLGSNRTFASLEIHIKNGIVSYISGGATVYSSPVLTSQGTLYGVGIIGFSGNKIVDISLQGGVSIPTLNPDFSKEIFIPCLGLTTTSQNPLGTQNPRGTNKPNNNDENLPHGIISNIQIRVATNQSFELLYPDDFVSTVQGTNNWYVVPDRGYNIDNLPFTLRIRLPNGLSHLTGLRVVNGLISTETSLERNLGNLSGLKDLELRSSVAFLPASEELKKPFYPNIGNIPFPVPSSLETALLEGTFNTATSPDLSYQQSLKNLCIAQYVNSAVSFQPCAASRLEFLEFTTSVLEILKSNALINFRQMFNPARTNITHGIRVNRSTQTSGGVLNATTQRDLAIANRSAVLLYGSSWNVTNNQSFMSLVNTTAGLTFGNGTALIAEGSNVQSRSYVLTAINNNQVTIRVRSTVNHTAPAVGNLLLIYDANSPTNRQLRLISGVTQSNVTDVVNIAGTNYTLSFVQYVITVARVRNPLALTGLTVANNNSQQANTFIVSGLTNENLNNIFIGDTAWQGTLPTLPISTANYYPATVIRKGNDSVTLLQSSTNQISAGLGVSLTFAFEFSSAQDNFSTNETYISDAINQYSNTSLRFTLETGDRASYRHLVS